MSDERPTLRVISGSPTPEELAVVAAVVAAAAAAAPAEEPPPPARGRWADPARSFRRPLLAGPGGWRAGLLG